MRLQQLQYFGKSWKVYLHSDGFDRMQCQLVLAFGEPALITDTSVFNHLERSYPKAHIILCAEPGAMQDGFENSVLVTAVEFDNTFVHCVETDTKDHTSSFEAGYYLMQQLQKRDLHAAFIVSDGALIDAGKLVDGFHATNSNHIPIINAMAGDDQQFTPTYVGLNKSPGKGMIVAIGFYGSAPDCLHLEQYLRPGLTALVNTTLKP
jgi:hypothetical protein